MSREVGAVISPSKVLFSHAQAGKAGSVGVEHSAAEGVVEELADSTQLLSEIVFTHLIHTIHIERLGWLFSAPMWQDEQLGSPEA